MGIRIPKNQIVQNKYTTGKEYMFIKTYREYQGYYYELNGKTYAGKEFNPGAYELIKIQSNSVNNLLTNPSTYIYGKVSGNKISTFKPQSHVFQNNNPNVRYVDRYFIQKININPILIKEVNEEIYKQSQSDPLYKSVTIRWDTIGDNIVALDKAEKQMPGIKEYLQHEEEFTTPGDSFED